MPSLFINLNFIPLNDFNFWRMLQRLASDFLSNYIFLSVGRVGSSTELIVQKVEHVQDTKKRNHLMGLLRGQRAHGVNGKVKVFLYK